MAIPDLNLFFMDIYGGFGLDWPGWSGCYLGLASGLSQPGNPPYGIGDFLAMFPKFFGPPTYVSGVITQGTAVITGVGPIPIALIVPGQLITASALPAGTIVVSVDTGSGSITVSNQATDNATVVAVYEAPPVPLAIIQVFINLANASLMSSRWRDTWIVAMGWYIAHMLTMYLRSEGTGAVTAAQVAQSGIERGLITSKSAGDVSGGIQHLDGLAGWAAWTETTYGTQLATIARVIGAGPTYVR